MGIISYIREEIEVIRERDPAIKLVLPAQNEIYRPLDFPEGSKKDRD